MVRQEADMLFCLLTRAEIANGNCVMRLSTEIHRPQDKLSRNCRSIRMTHVGFNCFIWMAE